MNCARGVKQTQAVCLEWAIELIEAMAGLARTKAALGNSRRIGQIQEQANYFYRKIVGYFPSAYLTGTDKERLRSRVKQIQVTLGRLTSDNDERGVTTGSALDENRSNR
jgi:hypothetical protein